MNFFIENMKNIEIGTRIRIHFGPGSGSTFPKCGTQDPDPRQNEMDPKRCFTMTQYRDNFNHSNHKMKQKNEIKKNRRSMRSFTLVNFDV